MPDDHHPVLPPRRRREPFVSKSGTGMGVLRANLGTPVSVAELRE
jgi:hypothetical protein